MFVLLQVLKRDMFFYWWHLTAVPVILVYHSLFEGLNLVDVHGLHKASCCFAISFYFAVYGQGIEYNIKQLVHWPVACQYSVEDQKSSHFTSNSYLFFCKGFSLCLVFNSCFYLLVLYIVLRVQSGFIWKEEENNLQEDRW